MTALRERKCRVHCKWMKALCDESSTIRLAATVPILDSGEETVLSCPGGDCGPEILTGRAPRGSRR